MIRSVLLPALTTRAFFRTLLQNAELRDDPLLADLAHSVRFPADGNDVRFMNDVALKMQD